MVLFLNLDLYIIAAILSMGHANFALNSSILEIEVQPTVNTESSLKD